jgi:hypothetical protein
MESLLYSLGIFLMFAAPAVAIHLSLKRLREHQQAVQNGLTGYSQMVYEGLHEVVTEFHEVVTKFDEGATKIEEKSEGHVINSYLSLAKQARTIYEIGKGGIEARLVINGNLDAALMDYGGRKTEAVDKLMGVRDELKQYQIQHEQTKPPKESALYEIDKIIETINSDVLKTPEQI